MSPAAGSPDAMQRALRASARAAEAGWTARDLARMERRVLAGAAASRPVVESGMPGWLPVGAVAAAAAAAMFMFIREPGDPARFESRPDGHRRMTAGVPAGSAQDRLDPAGRAALGLDAGDELHRIVLAGFESWTDTAAARFTGEARPELVPGGHTGRMALAAPAGDGAVEFEVPAAHRLALAGVSVRLRSADPAAAVTAVAGLEDGREVELTAAGEPGPPAEWRRILFPVPAAASRDGGGVRWLRFRVTGREPAKLDTMEAWTTATEGRR